MNFSSIIIPILVLGIILYGVFKKADIFSLFIEGAKENIFIGLDILPSLVLLMLAVGMLKASGALDALTALIAPVTERLGIPESAFLWR